jgi:hypothetical protein
VLVKNCLDLLRFIALPTDEGSLRKREGFLVDPSGGGGDDGLGGDGDSSGDEDEDNDGNAVARLAPGKAGRGMKRVLDAPADAAAGLRWRGPAGPAHSPRAGGRDTKSAENRAPLGKGANLILVRSSSSSSFIVHLFWKIGARK